MKKGSSVFHLIINAAFIGILLSFSIFYLTTMLVGTESSTAATCYDGTVIEGDNPGAAFRRAVYQNSTTLSFIREYQYHLFGIADQSSVVMGEKDFLFELRDPAHHYNYLDDYTGNHAFSKEELDAILAELEARRDFCAQRNAEYLLVVIPNSQTVYSEYMPSYLGDISSNTRLNGLKSHLIDHGFYDCLDLSGYLRHAKQDGLLYNTTENSLNALGIYHAYRTVCDRISGNMTAGITPLPRSELLFYQHVTKGKSTAQKAGVADFVYNHTVSLANNTLKRYSVTVNSGLHTTTQQKDCDSTAALLLQFSNASGRALSEIFFSNTVPQVTYQSRLSLTEETFRICTPQVVVQFIYENELSALIP
jgi:hypothetical protein